PGSGLTAQRGAVTHDETLPSEAEASPARRVYCRAKRPCSTQPQAYGTTEALLSEFIVCQTLFSNAASSRSSFHCTRARSLASRNLWHPGEALAASGRSPAQAATGCK